MEQQYTFQRYRYRNEWRIRKVPVKIVSLRPWDVRKTGKGVTVATGLTREGSIFEMCRMIERQGHFIAEDAPE